MRYFCYNEPIFDEQGNRIDNEVIVLSEDEICEKYWDYWYDQMCEKYGKEHVDANYCWEDCLDDWVVVNWAWESK